MLPMKLDYYFNNLRIKSDVYKESLSALFLELSPSELKRMYKISKLVEKCRNLAGKSIWSSRSFYKLIHALNPYSNLTADEKLTRRQKQILEEIINDKVPPQKYAISEIFQAIYIDQCLKHKTPSYESKLTMPSSDKTVVVLVDGFMNELYQTASFKRSIQHLHRKYGFDFEIPKVNGLETSSKNKDKLLEDLQQIKERHPEKKIWCFSFSKGGLDSLFCALEYQKFFDENVVGVSTISSPLRGTGLADHYIVRKLDTLFKIIQDGKFASIAEELNESNLDLWFERNLNDFPTKTFFTSLGFASPLHQSHVYMRILKLVLNSKNPNDGIIEEARAHFPHYFPALNLGTISAHHLVGLYSSHFDQEALLKAHLILFRYLGYL